MTSHFTSEEELFHSSESDTETIEVQRHSRHGSFGPRLPISIKSPSRKHRAMESPSTPVQGSGSRAAAGSAGKGKSSPLHSNGSALGFPNLSFSETDDLVLHGTTNSGQKVSFNIFETLYPNNSMGVRKLEELLNYMNAKGKLDFSTFIDGIVYQGFDRLYYIKVALSKLTVSQFCRFAILGAVRGSNFEKISQSCLAMPTDLTSAVNGGTVVRRAKKRDDLTILRCTASIPHWVSFWLFSVDMPKKIETEECPGWLQFPGAASLPMGKKQRLQHISFCKAFSSLLPGGSFNGNIYYTAYSNAIPMSDVPSILKDGLGISAGDTTSGTITAAEVQEMTTKAIVRV